MPLGTGRSILTSSSGPSFEATGGSTYDITLSGTTYKVHRFNSSGTFTVSGEGKQMNYLIVAGGGGGGGADDASGGGPGAGAGGLIYQTATINPGTYTITVGGGGASCGYNGNTGSNGSNSAAFGKTAIGGGGGNKDTTNRNVGAGGSAAGTVTSVLERNQQMTSAPRLPGYFPFNFQIT